MDNKLIDDEEYINKITLKYLINNTLNNKLKTKNNNIKINDSDINFYKKRILNTTREFLKVETDPSYNSIYREDKYNFLRSILMNYTYNLINHFKHEDIKDIIQEQIGFNHDSVNNNKYINEENNLDEQYDISNNQYRDYDYSLAKKKLVKYDWQKLGKIHIPNSDNIIIPQITKYNLKTEDLKNKGLKIKQSKNKDTKNKDDTKNRDTKIKP